MLAAAVARRNVIDREYGLGYSAVGLAGHRPMELANASKEEGGNIWRVLIRGVVCHRHSSPALMRPCLPFRVNQLSAR